MVVNDDLLVAKKYPNKPEDELKEEEEKKGIWELFKSMFEDKQRKDTGKFKNEY